jgi:hypothetical protein
MSRKLSPYARKMRRKGDAAQHFQGAAWLNTIQACRNFSDEAPEWSGLAGNMTMATDALIVVRAAVDDMLNHRVDPESRETFNLISHAIDVAHIRFMQIQPDEDNPAHAPLLAAKAALHSIAERRRRTGKWGLAGPDRAVLAEGIDLYETVLLSSSPEQMHKAAMFRLDALKRGKVWGANQNNTGDTK